MLPIIATRLATTNAPSIARLYRPSCGVSPWQSRSSRLTNPSVFPCTASASALSSSVGCGLTPSMIATDVPIGSGDDKAGRVDVLIERRLVPIREPDDIGDTLYHRLRSSQEMPAVIPRQVIVDAKIFGLGGRDIGRCVAWIDADHDDLKIAPSIESATPRARPRGSPGSARTASCTAGSREPAPPACRQKIARAALSCPAHRRIPQPTANARPGAAETRIRKGPPRRRAMLVPPDNARSANTSTAEAALTAFPAGSRRSLPRRACASPARSGCGRCPSSCRSSNRY